MKEDDDKNGKTRIVVKIPKLRSRKFAILSEGSLTYDKYTNTGDSVHRSELLFIDRKAETCPVNMVPVDQSQKEEEVKPVAQSVGFLIKECTKNEAAELYSTATKIFD
ncbi:hypothetical protein ACTXT7_004837 [Hymenolepis weldensis]